MSTANGTDALRITMVADELRGLQGGGIGTATSHLALALARAGYNVDVLYVGPRGDVAPEWARRYRDAGVEVRMLERRGISTQPAYFARMCDISLALEADPPAVVITQDLGAPTYAALRLRHLGLALETTLFIVLCHGTRSWITDVSRKARVLPGAHALSVLERGAIELANVAVSPSRYMLEWMRGQRWRLPERAAVIPYLTAASALDLPQQPAALWGGRPERIVFFGRLEPRKGIWPFVEALNDLDSRLLADIELVFLGRAAPLEPTEIGAALSAEASSTLRGIRFECELEHDEALAMLSQPGTLAVMPSLEDNSPNTVYECLERGIPFLTSARGGAVELIAPEDRDRVLVEPSREGIAQGLRTALESDSAFAPVRGSFDAQASLVAWTELLGLRAAERKRRPGDARALDVVVEARFPDNRLARCLEALADQSYRPSRVLLVHPSGRRPEIAAQQGLELSLVGSASLAPEAMREAALAASSAPWLVFLDGEDVPSPELLETLVTAQAASEADIVSCGFFGPEQTLHLFPGDGRGLGVLQNGYGQVALLRRSLLTSVRFEWPIVGDPDWPLLARLAASGATIVAVPRPLLTRRRVVGTVELHPSDALLVARELERVLPEQARLLARLTVGLAADAAATTRPPQNGSLARRVTHLLQQEGIGELARRTAHRLRRSRAGSGS